MRAILAGVFLLAAIWRAGMDWQATIGKGYAFRLGTLGSVISGQWPDEYAQLVESLKLSGVPFAWNPVGAVVMSLPLALVLATVAAILWLTRPRASRRAR